MHSVQDTSPEASLNTPLDFPAGRYTLTAMGLHWVLALALTGSFVVGSYMVDLPFSPQRLKLYNWHKWAGIVILVLSALRLVWRLTHRPPALPESTAATAALAVWQVRAAAAVHALLYILFFAVPVAGWAYSSAAGFPVVLFGVWPLPDLLPKDKAVADLIKPVHAALAWTLAAAVILHVAAALKHHFIDRDGLLHRMRPGG
jgi:cytochrome b561